MRSPAVPAGRRPGSGSAGPIRDRTRAARRDVAARSSLLMRWKRSQVWAKPLTPVLVHAPPGGSSLLSVGRAVAPGTAVPALHVVVVKHDDAPSRSCVAITV